MGEIVNNNATRNLFGRREIVTGAVAIDGGNVVKVISDAYQTHFINRDEIEYLYNYYKGKQPVLGRVKDVRPEITNRIVENRANAIVSFLAGYMVGKPVQYISSVGDVSVSDEIAKLNDLMRIAGKSTKDTELVKWLLIGGVCNRLILPGEGVSPFDLYTLDPRDSFVIHRNDVGHTPIAGVYVSKDDSQETHFDVYTVDTYYHIVGWQSGKIVERRPLTIRRLPIVEYVLNTSRLGAFEIVLPLLDALNDLDSNRLDSVAQFVQSLLVATNCAFEDGVTANTIREAGMVALKSVGDTKADIKVISESLDQSQTQTLKQDLLDAIYEIAGVPSQGHGNTSDSSNNGAVILKNGWQGAETKAQEFEQMFREPEQKTLALVTDICRGLGAVDIDPRNVDVKFTRRNYEDLLSKSQTLVTMLGNNKIHPQCAYEACGLFVDTQDAYNLGMEWYEAHGEANGTVVNTDAVNPSV